MRSDNKNEAPKWPFKILEYLLKEDYLEEIQGDMEEVYQDNLEKYSLRKARNKYIWDAMKLLRPSLLKNGLNLNLNSSSMVRNNLKIAFRVFKREKSYTFINVIGLSTALAIALLIIQYVQFEFSYEKYNPNAERLVRITTDYMNGNIVVEQDCETFPPLGPLITSEQPEVEDFTRAYHVDHHTIKIGEALYREPRMYATDPSFFRLFNYPLLHGSLENIFLEPYEVVLTESTALKYFNRTDVIGENIWWPSIKKDFKITGIVPDSPPNTHLKFDVLISYPTMEASFREKPDNWGGNNTYTYLLLGDKNNYGNFVENLNKLNIRLIKEKKFNDINVTSELISDIHLYSTKSFEPEKTGDATSVLFLLGVAFLVIIIAVVNYINLSTSKSLDRAKEVGIRKIVGSSLTQLRVQFFTESLLINLMSGLGALLLIILFIENFKYIAQLPNSFSLLDKPSFWYFLLVILLTSTLLSGFFPAVILSSFKPALVLKGKFAHSRGGISMRKGLVVFQFAITLFLLIQTLTAGEQLRFMRQKDLGLNIEQTVVLHVPSGIHQTMKYQILNNSEFQSAAFSNMVPGQPSSYMSTTTGINLADANNDNNYNFYLTWIDADYIPTMQMELLAGENFIHNVRKFYEVIVNEEAIKLWGIPDAQSAIGKNIKYWGREATIVGVVKNFHMASAKSAHLPMIFIQEDDDYSFLSIRTNGGNVSEQLATIKDIFHANIADSPFEYFFLDHEFDKQYKSDEQFQQVFSILTAFTVLIACLGLYGLASFTISRRKKEIGIRKVMGARILQMIMLLSQDFLKLIAFSFVLAIPVTYLILNQWLNQYAFRIDLNIWMFIGPAIILLIISFLTVFAKTYRMSNLNPVDSLRSE